MTTQRWVDFHIWICRKLGVMSIYEYLSILREHEKDIDQLIAYIDTFGGLQHLLNKQICSKLNIDPVDIRLKKDCDDISYQ